MKRVLFIGSIASAALTSCSPRSTAADAGGAPFGSASATFSAIMGGTFDASPFKAATMSMAQRTQNVDPTCISACAQEHVVQIVATEGARKLSVTLTTLGPDLRSDPHLQSSTFAATVTDGMSTYVWFGTGAPTMEVAAGGHVTIDLAQLVMSTQTGASSSTLQLDGTVILDCDQGADASSANCKSAQGPAVP